LRRLWTLNSYILPAFSGTGSPLERSTLSDQGISARRRLRWTTSRSVGISADRLSGRNTLRSPTLNDISLLSGLLPLPGLPAVPSRVPVSGRLLLFRFLLFDGLPLSNRLTLSSGLSRSSISPLSVCSTFIPPTTLGIWAIYQVVCFLGGHRYCVVECIYFRAPTSANRHVMWTNEN
jgi:hypothetical protein